MRLPASIACTWPLRTKIDASVRAYAHLATVTEWPLLAERRSSPEAAAELDAAEKNRRSHRGQALARLIERLERLQARR